VVFFLAPIKAMRTIALVLLLFLSQSVLASDDALISLLRKYTRGIPTGAVVTWSRAPFELALQRKILGREIGQDLVMLGFKPIDQYLPIPTVWSAAHNLECVLAFAAATPNQTPIYSLTEVYERKSEVLNLHGAELKVWEALGRKTLWGPEVASEKKTLNGIRFEYLEPSEVPAVKARFGLVPAIQSVLPPIASFANGITDSNEYWMLAADTKYEIEQWYKGQDLNLARAELDRILQMKTLNSIGLDKLKDIWPPQKIAQPQETTKLVPIEISDELLNQPHGMVGLDTYLNRRLGSNLIWLIRNNRISVRIFAGDEVNLPDFASYIEVPSIYARRAVHKYFSTASNTLVIQIPPLEEFAKHFIAMVKLAGGKNVKAWLSQRNQTEYRRNTYRDLANVWQVLGLSLPHVFLNGNPWLRSQLQSPQSVWETLEFKTQTTSRFGITLEAMKIRHKASGLVTTVVSVSSMQYRWGDGAAVLAEAFLKLGVKSITTYGFVGAPGIGKPNDLSVPGRFFLKNNEIELENFLVSEVGLKMFGEDPATIHFNTTHTQSFSPAEQTRPLVTEYIRKGYQTLDVEQVLVAMTVANFNKKNTKQVAFGSIGLITDVPRSKDSQIGEDFENLDNVDSAKRARGIATGAVVFEQALYRLEQRQRWIHKLSTRELTEASLHGCSALLVNAR
jgi:hypothetical protein